ncbi:hypothetical protein F4803DRAFT_570024 [Xylaria telfairii]|nr:hypothetical protein F4803DRAFT_570024 [Xylaria telfairii]
MVTDMNSKAQASTTNDPNEPYKHAVELFRSPKAISGIQVANGPTPVADNYHSHHYHQHRHNIQFNLTTQGFNPLYVPPPYSQHHPGHFVSPATSDRSEGWNNVIVGPSAAFGFQNNLTPRAPYAATAQVQPISINYQGNRLSHRNQSANIPPENSTSVWITNLPPNCNYAQLLGVVRDTGKVYATVINPPQGNFTTSAAKIVFFDVEARRRFEALANAGDLAVDRYVPRVRPNRILTAAQPAGPESRILHITGPASFVNERVLCDRFRGWCAFDLEYVQRFPFEDGNATMVWAFGSYRCQAERVFAAIRHIKTFGMGPEREIWDCVVVRYGPDPCDR